MALAESQMAHRQSLEKIVVSSNVWAGRIGQIFAFIIGMTLVVGGLKAVYQGKGNEGFGVAAIATAITGLVAIFIFGRRKEAQERQQKVESLPLRLK